MNDIDTIGIENIRRIHFDKFEKDFSFIVNGKVYQTNSFVATILSPNITNMFERNMNAIYYEINTKYEGDFNRIIEYGEMKKIDINEEEKQYFINILKQLGNNSEFLRFSKELQEDISYENVMQRIQTKKELGLDPKEEIEFISINFHDFHMKNPEAISTCDADIMERIISNDKLKLDNEEELFDIILKLYIKSKEYSILFSYVIFLNISIQSIREFNQNFDINDINKSIWENICCRLEQDISPESMEEYKNLHQELLYKRYTGKKYEQNIIQYLSAQCNGNVHNKKIVYITSSSQGGVIGNIVEKNDHNCFVSKDVPNSWIQFDFNDKKVLLDSYTLKSRDYGKNGSHLKSWILEVSNDGQNFTEIDRHTDCDLLNGFLKTATFNVSYSTPQRFVRLKQIDRNWAGFWQIVINQIEFSGFLYTS